MPHATKILAVDDREENLTALAAVLDSLPVDVVTVTSGRDALRELLREEFALILLDVVMPDMDGFETAGHIKSRARTRDVPIIFLTAAGSAGDQAFRGYEAGAVDYLTKPFDPWLLRAKVSVFLELHRRDLQVRRQAAVLREAISDGVGEAASDRVLKSLHDGVTLIEDDLAELRAHAAGAAALDRIEGHVAELRATLDTLAEGG
ncbi:response regulator [Actinomadura barringtoniae]|uniref:Response regulator n=1 Tax=Actinomadura barringtoniae TaxID=1427535 RepID=A0A939P8Y9_9ACTN|nr:response regulator [Actinomadura barringtoniae]MBO2448272.1 response regulator [Actinomadura barringtoniae]